MHAQEVRKFILSRANADLSRLQSISGEWWIGLDRAERGRTSAAMLAARHERIVLYAPAAWLGRPLTMAERQAFSRELAAMEADGLVERIGDGGRTTHIKLLGEM